MGVSSLSSDPKVVFLLVSFSDHKQRGPTAAHFFFYMAALILRPHLEYYVVSCILLYGCGKSEAFWDLHPEQGLRKFSKHET